MKLQIATITVEPREWGEIRKLANAQGLHRAAFLRLLMHEALKKSRAENGSGVGSGKNS